MPRLPTPRNNPRPWAAWLLVGAVGLLALAPWWKQRAYLRSFYDYGVVIGGAGRIADGQKPYVDFITPTQTGWYYFNRLAEQLGDGTFQAMTLGAAICSVVSLVILLWMLTRFWPLVPAALVAGALVFATTAQHTLFWYNSWGVVLLAVVAWAGAAAPVLRREHTAWHLLAAAALFLGGINKINMQLMALGLAWGWAVGAGLRGQAGWGRVGATLLFYLGFFILPVLAEMAWTGASFAAWWYNVVALPVASRSGLVLQILSPKFLFVPFHDFYRPLLLPQVGLCGMGLTVLTMIAIWRHVGPRAGWVVKSLVPVCGAVAVLGGVVLLSTNIDIAYIGLAGWLALLVALWIGFGLPARGAWFYGALVVPVTLVGAVAWHSAWLGQRSQFGHSQEPRSAYVDGAQAGPDFAYLKGTRLPPEFIAPLRMIAEWRKLNVARGRPVYYGQGAEWAAHIWPAMHTPGLPLYVQSGNSISAAEEDRLEAAMLAGTIPEILVSHVADHWSERESTLLEQRYDKTFFGGIFSAYNKAATNGVTLVPIEFIRTFGGNTDGRYLNSDMPFQKRKEGQQFIGITKGSGEMRLTLPSNRLQGEAVVSRLPGAPQWPVKALFRVFAQKDGTNRHLRWVKEVELPAGEDQVVVSYAIDSSHLPTTFIVDISGSNSPADVAAAGWRGPHLSDTGEDGPAEPDWFHRGVAPIVSLDEATLARVLPGAWRPERALLRGGRVTADGIELSPGGELWLQARGIVSEFSGTATAVAASGQLLRVRGLWYRGGRLEIYSDKVAGPDEPTVDFNTWCSESGGWLVIAVDPAPPGPAFLLHVQRVTQKQ